MRRWGRSVIATAIALAVALLAGSPAAVRAQEEPVSRYRWEAAARLALALPIGGFEGDAYGTSNRDVISDYLSAGIPVTGGFGVRRLDRLYLGLAATYAPVRTKNSGCPSSRCLEVAASALFAMLELQYRFSALAGVRPWLGVGAGGEWVNAVQTDYLAPVAKVQGGGQYSLGARLMLGPYLGFTFGQFVHRRYSSRAFIPPELPPLPPASDYVANRVWHGWFELGFAGTFQL